MSAEVLSPGGVEERTNSRWDRFFDDHYQAYYLVHKDTHESVWEIDHQNQIHDARCNNDECTKDDDNNEGRTEEDTLYESSGDHDYSSDYDLNNQFNDIISTEEVTIDNASDSLLSPPPLSISLDATTESYRTYSIYVVVNAVFIEAPFSVLEGILRCGLVASLLLIKGSILMLGLLLGRIEIQSFSISFGEVLFDYGQELLLTLAAVMTLMVPGSIYYVYRRYSPHRNWKLEPIPTFLGYVDPRRFCMITICGGGASASNCDILINPSINGGHTNSTRRINQYDVTTNLDSWKGARSMMLIPRQIVRDIITFANG
jgi:hypothetical protein